MKKYLAMALSALMLLALVPAAQAASLGTAINPSVSYFDGAQLKNMVEADGTGAVRVSGSSYAINKPIADMQPWNIPGTPINTTLGALGTWDRYVMFEMDLVVTTPVSSSSDLTAAATASALTAATNELKAALGTKRYYANSVSYMAQPAIDPSTVVYENTAGTYRVSSYQWNWVIENYVFYYLPITGGNTTPYTVSVYEQNVSYGRTDFLFYIEYKDVLPANSSNVTVTDYGINKDYIRAYMTGEKLFVETVWGSSGLKPVVDTDLLKNNKPNPNYGMSKGYYPVDLQFYFKDAAGNALPMYSQITSIKYDTFDILVGTSDDWKAQALPFKINNAVTPWNSGFGRTTYLDADGSLKLTINIGQFGYSDNAASTTTKARFLTPSEYSYVLSSSAVTNETAGAQVNTFTGSSDTFTAAYLMNNLKTGVGEKSGTPMLWYQKIANTYTYQGEYLTFTINVNGIVYSFKAKLNFQSVNRVDAYSLSMSEANMTLTVSESRALSAVVGNQSGTVQSLPIVWSSSNAGVAKVSVNPVDSRSATVTGNAVGTAYIRADLSVEGKQAICMVNVVAQAEPVPVTPVITTVDYVVTCRALNVRTGAGTKNAKQGMVYRNDVVKVIEVKDDWAKIQWQNGTSYACLGKGKYLQPK